jgi:hypothetical protein
MRCGPWTGRIVNIMDELALQGLLDDVRTGVCSPDDAVLRLRRLPFADLGFAKVDHHRLLRQGLPEAVYGQGKTAEQCSAIVGELLDGGLIGGLIGGPAADPIGGSPVILTRADEEQAARALADHPGGIDRS